MTRARGASRPRFRLLPTLLLTLAILGLPTAVYAWGRTSSSFAVVAVEVSGTHLVPAKKAQRLLRDAYVGRNLFTITAGDVRRTLAPVSFVSGVRVDRDFPGTLSVTITEHAPAAYALVGARWYVVDEDGYAVCTAREAAEQLSKTPAPAKQSDASPVPTSASGGAAQESGSAADAAGAEGDPTASAGDGEGEKRVTKAEVLARLVEGPASAVLPLPRVAVAGAVRAGRVVDDEAAARMLAVITALPNSYRRKLAVVQEEDGQLTLRFAGGPVTVWGDSGRTLAKTVALRTVLAEYAAAGKACTLVDVSLPDRTLAQPVLR